MATYRAKAQLMVRPTGRPHAEHIAMGDTFESDEAPGLNWFPLDDEAKAAVAERFGVAAVTDAARCVFQITAQPFEPA